MTMPLKKQAKQNKKLELATRFSEPGLRITEAGENQGHFYSC